MAGVKGKVALITGGASGIGEASARLLAAEGATVLVADVDAARGEQVASEIGAAKSGARRIQPAQIGLYEF